MSARKRILVLATGGTIAGLSASPTSRSYVSGQLPVEALLTFLKDFPLSADIEAEQVSNVGSQDMGFEIWLALHTRIISAFSVGKVDGIVIVHGTDTVEETGFLLDLVLPLGPPVVLVSAMRPATALGADGPRNLASAIQIACDDRSHGRGVLVIGGSDVFAARDVYKAATSGTEAFRSFPSGAIAAVSPEGVRYHAASVSAPWRGAFSVPVADRLPTVAILHVHAAMSEAEIDFMIAADIDAFVCAGPGHGTLPQRLIQGLASLARSGKVIARASRIDAGVTTHNLEVDDYGLGFVAGGYLSPQKLRILLMIMLAQDPNIDVARIRDVIDWF